MRNIGLIFILVLIGLLIWKASEQEPPAESTRVGAAATHPQTEQAAPISKDIDLNPLDIPVEKSLHQNQEPIQAPPEEFTDDTPTVEESSVDTERSIWKDETGQNQVSQERGFERIIIPSIKVNANVISKPYSELTWDLSNLEQNVASLKDVPTQTTDNNLIFAGHVTVYDGSHGPFRYLFRLVPGDKVILQDEESVYTYSVREQILVYPEESSVLNDTPQLQLTLITCTTWDEESLSYLRRRVIFADLEKVESKEVLLEEMDKKRY